MVRSWSLADFAQVHFHLEFLQIDFVFGKLYIFLLDKRIGCWVSHRKNSKLECFVLSCDYRLVMLNNNRSLRYSTNFCIRAWRIQSQSFTLLGSCSSLADQSRLIIGDTLVNWGIVFVRDIKFVIVVPLLNTSRPLVYLRTLSIFLEVHLSTELFLLFA